MTASGKYGKGMRDCCDSLALAGELHIAGCANARPMTDTALTAAIQKAVNCDTWPKDISDIVDIVVANDGEMSTEQAVALGIILARSSTSSGDVGVKELVWRLRGQRSTVWEASPAVGDTYTVKARDNGQFVMFADTAFLDGAMFTTEAEAQAAAQADFETRIRSALTTPALAPQPDWSSDVTPEAAQIMRDKAAPHLDGVDLEQIDPHTSASVGVVSDAQIEAVAQIIDPSPWHLPGVDYCAFESVGARTPKLQAMGKAREILALFPPPKAATTAKVGEITDAMVEKAIAVVLSHDRFRVNFTAMRAALTAAQLSPVSAPTDAEHRFRLHWDAPIHLPHHPAKSRGIQTFETFEAAINFMRKLPEGAAFVSLTQYSTTTIDRSGDALASLNIVSEG